MERVDGRADGKRVSALVREALSRVRRQIELSNEAAAALARHRGRGPARSSRATSTASVFLRGNLVTLDGDAEAVARPRRSCASWPT